MDTQLGPHSISKKNIVWTTEMDDCLTEALIGQMQRGYRSFPNVVYRVACDELLAKCE